MQTTALHSTTLAFKSARKPQLAQAWAKELIRRCGVDLRIVGNPPPPGMLHVANHRSYIDIMVLASCSETTFLAKQEIKSWPLLGSAAERVGTVFVERGSRHSGATAMKAIGDRLARGESVTVFPEGTSTAAPGVGEFQKGVFRFAAQRRLPIVPVAVEYERATDAWTAADADSTFVPHFVNTFSRKKVAVRVAFGDPLSDRDPDQLRETARSWIQSNLEVPT
ncbi:MAG: lysophospholipid acyltransferase family protein [Myxococcaceae bacterium]